MDAQDHISVLPKTGPKVTQALRAMGIETLGDLLLYFPSRYLDFSTFTAIHDLQAGDVVTVRGVIKSIKARFNFRSKTNLAEAVVSDMSGSIKVMWFHQGYIAESLASGDEVLLSGKVAVYKNITQLINPVYEKVTEEHLHTGRLVPVYRLPAGIYPKTFRTLVHEALPAAESLPDLLPQETRESRALLDMADAVRAMHYPENNADLERATRRLAFEETFIEQLAVAAYKRDLRKFAAPSISLETNRITRSVKTLPYSLTESQKKALWDIVQDLAYKHPMNRLLQGDVGSGKTIVALLAALEVVARGYQVVLLAPTEVLARQHFASTARTLAILKTDVTPSLYTRSMHELNGARSTKQKVLDGLKTGDAKLIIGTHALLAPTVLFKSLALVIVDEQHRFGVAQRRSITELRIPDRIKTKKLHPHLLSMSATPIPRSAALAAYGDLDLSVIDELPKNRLPIKTWLVPEAKRTGAYEFIHAEVRAGRQAFIVVPLIEESVQLVAKSVKAEFLRLSGNVFPGLSLGLLHGGVKPAEKEKTMREFADGILQILVTTSVVEVGIDVPNASVMLIENADRFGLAQLHQLRGRVGRGVHQSYCFLFSETQASTERLELFARTKSGFALAEYDLATRGFGSLFGDSQTGFSYRYGKFLTLHTVTEARASAEALLKKSSALTEYPELQKRAFPLAETIHLE